MTTSKSKKREVSKVQAKKLANARDARRDRKQETCQLCNQVIYYLFDGKMKIHTGVLGNEKCPDFTKGMHVGCGGEIETIITRKLKIPPTYQDGVSESDIVNEAAYSCKKCHTIIKIWPPKAYYHRPLNPWASKFTEFKIEGEMLEKLSEEWIKHINEKN
jgi:5-methylcytosine-specific restriction endonuclease McrA